jgi:maltose alpha-D-glucosyltransferase/alpha-amylase
MLGQTEFPRITDQPYFLTLGPFGVYWFSLQEAVVPVTARVPPAPEEYAERPVLFAGVVWDSLLDGAIRTLIEREALVPFLQRQRWFGGKAKVIASARISDWTVLRRGAHPAFLALVDVAYRDGTRDRYSLPLAMSTGQDAEAIEQQHAHAVLARISGARKGLLYDGLFDDGTCATLLASIQEARQLETHSGALRATNTGLTADRAPADALTPIFRLTSEQSNTSIQFGQQLVLKLFRRVEPGPNPDVEIGRYLTAHGGARVPEVVGDVEYERAGDAPASLVVLQRYVWNQGNGWNVTIDELGRYFERSLGMGSPDPSETDAAPWRDGLVDELPQRVHEAIGAYVATAEVIGRRTGELHAALADDPSEPFAPEPITRGDVTRIANAMRTHAESMLGLLEGAMTTLDPERQKLAAQLLDRRTSLLQQFDAIERLEDAGRRIRIHGDYHLGQVLVTEGDVVIIDFEGEPARPIAERRAKASPMRDVAGMVRSFGYAAAIGLSAATSRRPEDLERFRPWASFWENWVSSAFLRAYSSAVNGAGVLPVDRDAEQALLRVFIVEKALYELGYELNNRPEWVHVPLEGLLHLLESSTADASPEPQPSSPA